MTTFCFDVYAADIMYWLYFIWKYTRGLTMRFKQKLIRTACLRRRGKPFVYTRPGICFYGSVGGGRRGRGACIHSSSTPFHVSRLWCRIKLSNHSVYLHMGRSTKGMGTEQRRHQSWFLNPFSILSLLWTYLSGVNQLRVAVLEF